MYYFKLKSQNVKNTDYQLVKGIIAIAIIIGIIYFVIGIFGMAAINNPSLFKHYVTANKVLLLILVVYYIIYIILLAAVVFIIITLAFNLYLRKLVPLLDDD